jgi:hypothetical protein
MFACMLRRRLNLEQPTGPIAMDTDIEHVYALRALFSLKGVPVQDITEDIWFFSMRLLALFT